MIKISLAVLLLFLAVTGTAQKAIPSTIYWKKERALTTDDFVVISDSSSGIIRDNLAVTRTGITYSLTSIPKTNSFKLSMFATMHPRASYIKKRVLYAPPGSVRYLMNHEQKHFDISEIYAREAIKAVSTARFTKNYATEINVLMQRIFRQSEAYQDLYDKETRNGVNAVIQKQWDDKITERLAALEVFTNKTITKRLN